MFSTAKLQDATRGRAELDDECTESPTPPDHGPDGVCLSAAVFFLCIFENTRESFEKKTVNKGKVKTTNSAADLQLHLHGHLYSLPALPLGGSEHVAGIEAVAQQEQ